MSRRIGNFPSPLPRVDVAWWFRNAGTPPRRAWRCSMPAAMPSMRRSPPRWRWARWSRGSGSGRRSRGGSPRRPGARRNRRLRADRAAALEAKRFTLTGRIAAGLVSWPEVEGDANIHGPLSFVIPSAAAGLAEMHGRWGRLPLAEIAAPSVTLARRGLPQDWYTTLKVASFRISAAQPSRKCAHLPARWAATGTALSGRIERLSPGPAERDPATAWRARDGRFLSRRDRLEHRHCRFARHGSGVIRQTTSSIAKPGYSPRSRRHGASTCCKQRGHSQPRRPQPRCCGRWRKSTSAPDPTLFGTWRSPAP